MELSNHLVNENIFEKEEDTYHIPSKISIAPMLDFTTPHFRFLMRQITQCVTLWTEMLHYNTILLSNKGFERELFFSKIEHPIVVQLGGNDPEMLMLASQKCKQMGYDEINLNCGCPSGKVVNSNFGACLMKQPDLVSECCRRMKNESGLPITVKCRLGLDEYNNEFLYEFINKVGKINNESNNVVKEFIIHSRIAIMGIDTLKNRTIPPLMYNEVYKLKSIYPCLSFILNGGITTKKQAIDCIVNSNNSINGLMIGRAAYDNPFLFSDFDSTFYNKKDLGLNREEIIHRYADYIDEMTSKYSLVKHHLIHPLSNIFNGERYNSSFKDMLFDHKELKKIEIDELSDHVISVLERFKKINPKAVERVKCKK